MVNHIHSILMLTAIVGHLLFGCACGHVRAAVDDADHSVPATVAGAYRFGPPKSSASPVDSMTIAAACPSCGEHSDSIPHPCEDNCCTFVRSTDVEMAHLTSADLFPPVLSPLLVAVCRPEQGQMQNADAVPSARPLSVDSREWLASWLL